MGPSESVTEYNVDFQQALTDLAGHVTDEQVKIEKYRAGLQHDLRQLCRTSPTGARWCYDCAWLSLTALSTVTRNL
jgi:hypothetical protein